MVLKGVLLINVGTPDNPSTSAIRKFLKEFLSDWRVINLPSFIRWILLNFFILPFRPHQIKHAYKSIWLLEGSPLLYHTKQLKIKLNEHLGENYCVEVGMRYGNPSLQTAIEKLISKKCEEIIVLPLFPQYASATTGSAIEKVFELCKKKWNLPSFKIIHDFFSHHQFIEAYAEVIQENLGAFKPDIFLFSYHGLPEFHLDKSEEKEKLTCDRQNACPTIQKENRFCYRAQCFETSKLLAQALKLEKTQYQTSFQSRLGKMPWIKPYTDELLIKLAQQNIKNITVVCPSFVTDCLETLEEIGIRAQQQWQALGGENLRIIPCLNTHPSWLKALTKIIQ